MLLTRISNAKMNKCKMKRVDGNGGLMIYAILLNKCKYIIKLPSYIVRTFNKLRKFWNYQFIVGIRHQKSYRLFAFRIELLSIKIKIRFSNFLISTEWRTTITLYDDVVASIQIKLCAHKSFIQPFWITFHWFVLSIFN